MATVHESFLDEQAKAVAAWVRRNGMGSHVQAIYDTQPLIETAYAENYTLVFPDLAARVYAAYAKKSFKAHGELIDDWLDAARRLVTSRPIRRRIKLVQQETIDAVNGITAYALENGLSIDNVADLIDGTKTGEALVDPYTGPPVYDTNVRQRARRIARTETMSAANSGSRQGILDTGLDTNHYWIDIRDKKTRDSHNTKLYPKLAEPRPIDKPFEVGPAPVLLMFPSDPNGEGPERAQAAETINCRCVEGYRVVGGDDLPDATDQEIEDLFAQLLLVQ